MPFCGLARLNFHHKGFKPDLSAPINDASIPERRVIISVLNESPTTGMLLTKCSPSCQIRHNRWIEDIFIQFQPIPERTRRMDVGAKIPRIVYLAVAVAEFRRESSVNKNRRDWR